MAQETAATKRMHVKDVIERYGNCIELVSMDPNFHNISVGLYEKGGVCTVWSFSRLAGVDERLRVIARRLTELGGMEYVNEAEKQVRFPSGRILTRPLKFLMRQAVEKAEDWYPPQELSVKDSKSPLSFHVAGREQDGRWVYEVSYSGEHKNPKLRLRAIIQGFERYGEMEKVDDNVVSFPDGMRNDPLLRLILPYTRNISQVEEQLEMEAMRGQMTTSTLGFSQT
ncbi:MAG: hypothetical protein ACOC5M_00455 [Chloroflexota bacterium]